MKLSPKAHRFATEAARELRGEAGRDRLLSWLDMSAGKELPSGMVTLVLSALARLEYWLRQRLDSGHLDEDQRADVINDIAFIHSIESDLKLELARGDVGA